MKTWKILSRCKFAVAPEWQADSGVAKHARSTDVSDMSKDAAFRHEQSAGHQKRGGNDGCFYISSSNANALAVYSAVHFFSSVQMKKVWK